MKRILRSIKDDKAAQNEGEEGGTQKDALEDADASTTADGAWRREGTRSKPKIE